MKVRIVAVDFYRSEHATRVPFRFGAVTLRDATLCTARVRIASDHGEHVGFAADLCVPKWFEKDPDKPPEQDVRELLDSARAAGAVLIDPARGDATVFDHWLGTYRERVGPCDPSASDRLVRGFGVALCERALIDAVCRAADRSFFGALQQDLFGFRPGELHAELDGWSLAESLPERPRERVLLRHTIGMLDALEDASLAPANRVDDGLPESLAADVRRYGLRCFKIKVGAGVDADFDRLVQIAEVLRREVGSGVTSTLDGNEQYPDLDAVAALLRKLASDERGRYLLDGLLYVEQPLARAATFDPARTAAIDEVTEFAQVIIDEADSGLDSFPRAHALGYRGISVKNCKGLFRALANRGLCEFWRDGSFQAAEDLTNLGVLSLQQDLATVAALDLEHVERNGHHYFRGLGHLPQREVEQALDRHADLYEPLGGGASLRIHGGELQLGSIQCAGYGYACDVDVSARQRI